MVVAEAQLTFAEDHPGGLDAADSPCLEPSPLAGVAIKEHGPLGGEGDLLARRDVRRAADDLLWALTGVDDGELEAIGVRVRSHVQHLSDPDKGGVPVAADDLPVFYLGGGIGDAARELRRRQIDIDEITNP
ncbi:MAG: hypothetical protein Kow0010_01250 [Dehalococcoidia bacterium]